MSVRVEKLTAPAAPLLPMAVLALLSSMAALLMRWWRQPAPLVMSEDWMSEQARIDSQRGWN
jgi:hypothetical protein